MNTYFELNKNAQNRRKVEINWDTLILENIQTYQITEWIFTKTKLTLWLKSWEILIYDWVDKEKINSILKK